MQTKYQHPPFLPKTSMRQATKGLTVLEPLSRRGIGPGMIVVVPSTGVRDGSSLRIEQGVPSPLMKWAEEGYTVIEITEAAFGELPDALDMACRELGQSPSAEPKNVIGLVAYSPEMWNLVASNVTRHPQIVGAVIYSSAGQDHSDLATASLPQVHHLSGKLAGLPQRTKQVTQYEYAGRASCAFATPFHQDFDHASESISHSRNLAFFKPLMGGPYFDLEAIWDEHVYYEFEVRSVESTMNTMVQEPYVNHVPTLTGGIGREKLTAFYRDHFIFQNPSDTETELISRSIGIDRVVDEHIFKCTHNRQIDWLVPGVPPTGRKLEVPFYAVVNIRGDRLYHEHIAWDQATVLRQLNLLPEYLPYPYPVSDIPGSAPWEYRLPVAGVETVTKLRDKEAVKSNEMFDFRVRSAQQ